MIFFGLPFLTIRAVGEMNSGSEKIALPQRSGVIAMPALTTSYFPARSPGISPSHSESVGFSSSTPSALKISRCSVGASPLSSLPSRYPYGASFAYATRTKPCLRSLSRAPSPVAEPESVLLHAVRRPGTTRRPPTAADPLRKPRRDRFGNSAMVRNLLEVEQSGQTEPLPDPVRLCRKPEACNPTVAGR